jgi:hypothetical protein
MRLYVVRRQKFVETHCMRLLRSSYEDQLYLVNALLK